MRLLLGRYPVLYSHKIRISKFSERVSALGVFSDSIRPVEVTARKLAGDCGCQVDVTPGGLFVDYSPAINIPFPALTSALSLGLKLRLVSIANRRCETLRRPFVSDGSSRWKSLRTKFY